MANKRILKKRITYSFGDLFSDVLICQHFLPHVDKKKAESIMSHISEMNNEFICRAHHAPNGGNKKEVKSYFQKLYQDLNMELNKIAEEIEQLSDVTEDKKA